MKKAIVILAIILAIVSTAIITWRVTLTTARVEIAGDTVTITTFGHVDSYDIGGDTQ